MEKESNSSEPRGFLVVVDDLTALLSIGFAALDVFRLFMAVREHINSMEGTLVVLLHSDQTTLPDVDQVNLLTQLSIMRGPRLNDTKFIPQTLLFHVAETGVKFFAPGHVP
ncbi:hypothetical protein HDU67_006132 [Dinochytrium kinnereticum]|nr:hypothetical protein HDU67_006132 [Dinochytrium kinnereticum]